MHGNYSLNLSCVFMIYLFNVYVYSMLMIRVCFVWKIVADFYCTGATVFKEAMGYEQSRVDDCLQVTDEEKQDGY